MNSSRWQMFPVSLKIKHKRHAPENAAGDWSMTDNRTGTFRLQNYSIGRQI